MKKIFKKTWDLALPYQDKRDDSGHAEIVTKYAIELCKIKNINEDVVVPAAILHDIGWSRLTKKERFLIFDPNKTPEEEKRVRIKHQDEGVKIAKNILKQVNYSEEYSGRIIEIISEHDTRAGFISPEEGLTRDADKLWRFSKIGFNADIVRNNFTFEQLKNKLIKKMKEENFFYSKTAEKIAREELRERECEHKISRKSNNIIIA